MRKLTVAAFASLDGVMQAPGGPTEDNSGGFQYGGWLPPFFSEASGMAVGELFSGDIALLLGRKTYDIFAGHWPRVKDDPFAAQLNAMTKYVATRAPRPLDWANSKAVGPDAIAAVRDIKNGSGPDLLTQGSSELVHDLLAAGLVDTVVVQTFPVILGSGKRLFGPSSAACSLKLIDTRSSDTGVVISRYERAGPVQIGAVEAPE